MRPRRTALVAYVTRLFSLLSAAVQLHPYSIALAAAAFVAAAQAVACWRRRDARGARPLAVTMAALSWWSAGYAVHFAVTGLNAQLVWLNLIYLGVALVPPSFLAFAHAFAGDTEWLTRQRVAWLAVHPVLLTVAVWTDPWHHTFYADVYQVVDGGHQVLRWPRGLLYWVHVAYSYALVMAGVVLLAHTFRRAPQPYRRQVALILTGVGVVVATAVVAYIWAAPQGGADLTAMAFVGGGLVLSRAISVYGLFDVLPVARSLVVERLRDAMLVLDARGRVSDANPAAARLLGAPSADALVGRPLAEACAAWPALVTALAAHDQTMRSYVTPSTPMVAVSTVAAASIASASVGGELQVVGPAAPRRRRADDLTVAGPGIAFDDPRIDTPWFDVQIVPLGETRSGGERVLLFRDVSERRAAQRRLEATNAQLELQLAENHRLGEELRRLAETDALTGAFNRRRLDVALPYAAAEAAGTERPLAVVMADIDHFKRVNDDHGHQTGDRLLAALAATLRSVVSEDRATGAGVFRYGGEEFVLVLPDTLPGDARAIAEACRVRFAGVRVSAGDDQRPVSTTLSLGVAAVEPPYGPSGERDTVDGAALLRAADRALYAAKAGGRNRVIVAGEGVVPPVTAEMVVEAA